MLDWLPYGFLHKYPHMGSDDAEVWERYIRAYPAAFDAVAYDVAVGAGAAFDTTVNPATGGHNTRNYQRRIDVIGKKGDAYTIVEVKKYATTGALGQIEGYALIAGRDMPELARARLLVLAGALAPEMEFLAAQKKIELLVV